MPYHMQPMPTPRRTGPSCVLVRTASLSARCQRGASASRQGARPALASSTWPVAVASPTRIAFFRRSSSRSMPSPSARSSSSASWAMAAAARRSRERRRPAARWCRRPGPAPRPQARHRGRGVNRHAACHGRPPGGIGAGIEGRVEFHRLQRAVAIAAHARFDQRWMALGARHHAFGPLVNAGDRLAREPGRERREWLDRKVELAAEAAAAGARHDPHLLRREAQHFSRHVAVHDRRLRRDE